MTYNHKEFNLILIEDAAEALGSFSNNKHLGTYGDIGTLSFNGNKIITTGGGGAVLTNNDSYAERIRHISTTARVKTKFTFDHDEIGYNYRMPNLNAALGIAQMENLEYFLNKKREVAIKYQIFFEDTDIEFFTEPQNTTSNYWLNTIVFKDEAKRNEALEYTNKCNIMTRPPWKLMTELNMFSQCERFDIKNSEELEKKILNIPSSVPIEV